MMPAEPYLRNHEVLKLRLETLTKIRWLAIAGQFFTVLFVALLLQFQFSLRLCLMAIVFSVALNIILRLRYRANFRASENTVILLLAFDILQLTLLLYLTGGLRNPFSLLLMAPVVISAATQSRRQAILLGALAIASISFLAFFHLPLPWYPGQNPGIPWLFLTGMWVAIVVYLIFTAFYAYNLADENRKQSNALLATEMILQRERYLSSLDGLAAAAGHELGTPLATIALVAREMSRELPEDSPLYQDARLLRSQAARCRDILQKMNSLTDEGARHIGTLSIASLVEEVVAPHRNFVVEIKVKSESELNASSDYQVFTRDPAIIYGLGNLVENAVDFACSHVEVATRQDKEIVAIIITDDGPGYPKEILGKIGEPYISIRNQGKKSGSNLGLGLFIAKTMLERSGASLEFSKESGPELNGARVIVKWQRADLERRMQSFSELESICKV